MNKQFTNSFYSYWVFIVMLCFQEITNARTLKSNNDKSSLLLLPTGLLYVTKLTDI